MAVLLMTSEIRNVAWVVPVFTVLASLTGAFIFGAGLERDRSRHRTLETATSTRLTTHADKKQVRDPVHHIESARLWALSAALAGGIGVGVAFAIAPGWWAAVDSLTSHQRTTLWIGMVAFGAFAVALVLAAPAWFRNARMRETHRPARANGESSTPRSVWSRIAHWQRDPTMAGPNAQIKLFRTRQVALGLMIGVPLVLALSGLVAVAIHSYAFTHGACKNLAKSKSEHVRLEVKCQNQMNAFLGLRGEFMHYLAASVVLLVLIVLVLAMAQRALRLRTSRPDYYRPRDVLLFGALMSILTGLIVLPAYALLQASGYDFSTDVVRAMKLPVDTSWFSARATTQATLAPPLSAKAFATGVVAVFTPLLTGAVTTFLTGKVDESATESTTRSRRMIARVGEPSPANTRRPRRRR